MPISVVVCTLNRAASLERTLESLSGQSLGPEQYETLVVDNGSVDRTREVVLRRMEGLPHLRYIHEPRQGLSWARNRGLHEAAGEFVAFLDDDAQASGGWLAAIQAAWSAPERIGAVGGKVELRWPERRPAWLPRSLEGYFSGFDLGSEARFITSRPYLFGTNMAVRRDLALAVGGFSPRLGRKGSGLGSHEETEFFDRLRRLGVQIYYQPRAVVYHQVLPERVSRRWLLRRVFAEGRSRMALHRMIQDSPASRWQETVRPFGKAIAEGMRSRRSPAEASDGGWLIIGAAAAYVWGCTVESAIALVSPPIRTPAAVAKRNPP